MTQAKNTIWFWYDGDADDAARFYADIACTGYGQKKAAFGAAF